RGAAVTPVLEEVDRRRRPRRARVRDRGPGPGPPASAPGCTARRRRDVHHVDEPRFQFLPFRPPGHGGCGPWNEPAGALVVVPRIRRLGDGGNARRDTAEALVIAAGCAVALRRSEGGQRVRHATILGFAVYAVVLIAKIGLTARTYHYGF